MNNVDFTYYEAARQYSSWATEDATFIVKYNGNVGIGATNPITKLDIRRNGGARLRLENTSGGYANQKSSNRILHELCNNWIYTSKRRIHENRKYW